MLFRYKSRFAEQIREEYETGRAHHLSMGEAATILPHPGTLFNKYFRGIRNITLLDPLVDL